MRRNKGEKVVKTRASWRKADQVRKIKIVMTFVVVALCISVAAGAVLAWIEIQHPFDTSSSSVPVSSLKMRMAKYHHSIKSKPSFISKGFFSLMRSKNIIPLV